MTGCNFVSDNVAPVHPAVMAAIAAANSGPAASYGEDAVSARLDETFGRVFEADVRGASRRHRHGGQRAHPRRDGRTGGAVLLPRAGSHRGRGGGRARVLRRRWGMRRRRRRPGADRPRRVARVAFRTRTAASSVLPRRRSGERCTPRPRSPSSLASPEMRGCASSWTGRGSPTPLPGSVATPADIAQRAGVDAVVFGTSKNGTLNAEAMLFFDPAFADELFPMRKRSGHAYSKMRYLSAQLEAYLAGGLWLELAARANAMARRLAEGLAGRGDVSLLAPVEANLIFLDIAGPDGRGTPRRRIRYPRRARERIRAPGHQLRDDAGRRGPACRSGAASALTVEAPNENARSLRMRSDFGPNKGETMIRSILLLALLLPVALPSEVRAGPVRIADFKFECVTPTGQRLKPQFGDMDGLYYSEISGNEDASARWP